MSLKPCLTCGEPSPNSHCDEHRPRHHGPHTGTARERGYDTAWDKLSRRARKAQDFCTDCGTRQNLTLDHLPEAWERVAAGKSLRLGIDTEVVCASCNNKRGARRTLRDNKTQGGDPALGPFRTAGGGRGDGHSLASGLDS